MWLRFDFECFNKFPECAMEVGIVIVSYNSAAVLGACLNSIPSGHEVIGAMRATTPPRISPPQPVQKSFEMS
jgi:hypothetical protein